MTFQPQGCSLTSNQFDEVAEIYALAADTYSANAQIAPGHATIRIHGSKTELKTLLEEMVERERGCCSHIAFDIADVAKGYQVTLRMPDQSRANVQQAVLTFFPAATILT